MNDGDKAGTLRRELAGLRASAQAHGELGPTAGPSTTSVQGFRTPTTASVAADAAFAAFQTGESWTEEFARLRVAPSAGAVPKPPAHPPVTQSLVLRPGSVPDLLPSVASRTFDALVPSPDARYLAALEPQAGGRVACHLWDLAHPGRPSHVVADLPRGTEASFAENGRSLHLFCAEQLLATASLEEVGASGMGSALHRVRGDAGLFSTDHARFFDGDKWLRDRDRDLGIEAPKGAGWTTRKPRPGTAGVPTRMWHSGHYLLVAAPVYAVASNKLGAGGFLVARADLSLAESPTRFALVTVRTADSFICDESPLSADGRYLRVGRGWSGNSDSNMFAVDCWANPAEGTVITTQAGGPYNGNPPAFASFAPDANTLLLVEKPGPDGRYTCDLPSFTPRHEPHARLFRLDEPHERKEVEFVGAGRLRATALLSDDRMVVQRADESVLRVVTMQREAGGWRVAVPPARAELPFPKL